MTYFDDNNNPSVLPYYHLYPLSCVAPMSADDDLLKCIFTKDFSGLSDAIQRGANVNLMHGQMCPLHFAVVLGSTEVVNTLLRAGANPNAQDSIGWTAAHFASAIGSVDHATILESLIANGANIAATDKSGRTPAQYASESGNFATMQVLRDNAGHTRSSVGPPTP